MADLRISELPEMTSGQMQASDPIAVVDLSASETKQVSAAVMVADIIQVLPDGTIPGAKVDFGDLPDGSVDTDELADKSVTAAKLANSSSADVGATRPSSGAFKGQIFVTNTNPPTASIWNGSSWSAISDVDAVAGSTTGLVNTYVSTSAGTATVSADIDNTSVAGQFIAGPAGNGGAVTARIIVPQDLPTAGVDKGAVAVDGNGLAMTGNVIGIDNNVTANTSQNHLVQYDANGLVTGGAEILPSDLPIATSSDVGVVRPGDGLAVDAVGDLSIANSIVAGTSTKITYDTNGLITGGDSLEASDIPNLDASVITTGDFPNERIGNDAISAEKLTDYATCLMQEATPGAGDYLGQLWFQPSIARLSVYARGSGPQNIWMPAGLGNLQGKNLRWGGTVNATTSKIVTLTALGQSEGLTAGDDIPEPSDDFSGLYFVVQTGGSGINLPNVEADTFTPGDWLLCIDAVSGWVALDVSAGGGGGGGGGATSLNQLSDVAITSPQEDDLLQFNSVTAVWENTGILSGGTF